MVFDTIYETGQAKPILSLRNMKVIQTNSKDGSIQERTYDSRGNILLYRYEEFSASYTYNWKGKLLSYRDSNDNFEDFSYDDKGQLISKSNSDGGYEEYFYNGKGKLIKLVEHNGPYGTELITREYKYDKRGNMIRCEIDNGLVISNVYDDKRNIISIKDSNGSFDEYTYDDKSRLLSVTHHSTRYHLEITYNDKGNILTTKDNKGGSLVCSYINDGKVLVAENHSIEHDPSLNYSHTYEYLSIN